MFSKAFFDENICKNLLEEYALNPIVLNEELMKWWISDRNVEVIMKELEQLSGGQMHFYNINKIKMIQKEENITKGDIYSSLKEMTNRVVLWNPYVYSLMFAPIYSNAKYRFKNLLKPNVIYAEDMDYNKFVEKLNEQNKTDDYVFFESDLSKQDRQTDQHSLQFEKIMYERLGVHKNLNNYYMSQHNNTQLSVKYFKTTTDPKRHTGQTTVGFGNIINNMRTYSKLFSNIKYDFICLLGDDLLAHCEKSFDEEKLSFETKVYHNMESTYEIGQSVGIFCQLLVGKTEYNYIVGANLIRLEDRLRSCYRFNNNYLQQTFIPKCISYCFLMGLSGNTKTVCDVYNYPSPTFNTPNKHDLIKLNAAYHDETIFTMETVYNNIIHTMLKPSFHIQKVNIVSFKGNEKTKE